MLFRSTAGLRDDTIRAIGPRTLRDPATGKFRFATADDQATFTPVQRNWFSTDEQTGVRKSVGAVLHLTRNFSLIANYATGVGLQERNRSSLPEDETPPPTRGVSRDLGVAFSFLDNRVSGSLKWYSSKSLGERIQGGAPVFVNPNNDVMSSFDYYFRQANLTTFAAGDPIRNVGDLTSVYLSAADSYLSDQISKGAELEVIANPTRNWTLRASYSRTDRVVANTFFEALPWWADRVRLWKSLDSLYTQRTGRPSNTTCRPGQCSVEGSILPPRGNTSNLRTGSSRPAVASSRSSSPGHNPIPSDSLLVIASRPPHPPRD